MAQTYEDVRLSDLAAHEQTYCAFNVVTRWAAVLAGAAISALTLWFATNAGFLTGATAAALVMGLGYRFAVQPAQNRPLRHDHEGLEATTLKATTL